MPVDRYFGGHGRSVMADMRKKHGEQEGKRIFYATANARHQNPKERSSMKALRAHRSRR